MAGSSRSARDDSRQEKHGRERVRSRSPREREPRRRHSPTSSRHSNDRSYDKEDRYSSKLRLSTLSFKPSIIHIYKPKSATYYIFAGKHKHTEWDDSDEEVPAPPPPPRITKISIPMAKPKAPIKMSLGGPSKLSAPAAKPTIASVFNDDDDDDEPEEMPAEARMRMRNIGR